ncbi:MAG: hypothetical protein WCH75_09350, partial [Candidatus Binatia bacterium]
MSHVANPNYQPVKPAVIAKQLGLSGEATQELKRVIKRMVKAGELAWGPSHLVFPPATAKRDPSYDSKATAAKAEVVVVRITERKKDKARSKQPRDSKHFTGTFRRAAGGFGFVRPER